MAGQINVQPQGLNLALYAGDGFSMRVICKTAAGDPVDITGAVAAEVRLTPITVDPPIVEFAADLVDAYLGIVVISLTGEQTTELSEHASSKAGTFTGVWDLEWDPVDREPRTLCAGRLECISDVTR